jgi:cytosine permease
MIPPVGAVLIIHYFMNRKQYTNDEHVHGLVNIGNVAAVIVGSLTGVLLNWGIAPINALVTASLISLISQIMTKGKDK